MRDSLKNPLHFVGIRQSAPTVKKKKKSVCDKIQWRSVISHFEPKILAGMEATTTKEIENGCVVEIW